MDWANIDLESACERDASIIDAYHVWQLLLEVSCSLPEINEETVMELFETELQCRIDEARWVMNKNIKNIVQYARKERNERIS